MTNGLPSKAIPASWRAGRTSEPSREQRITNHSPAGHASRRTIIAKESTTSPRAPRPTCPHRVTLPPTPAASWRTAVPCRAGLSPASALGHRPMTRPSAPVPDTFADQQSMAKPTHRAQSASDGLGRIVRTAPQPPPGPRTHLGPTPTAPPNLPHLTESATPSQAPKPANRPNPVAEGSSLAENRVLGSQAHRPKPSRTKQTQSVAGSSPHARIHIRASVPVRYPDRTLR